MTARELDSLVPRETADRLRELLDLVTHWNRRINLLSRGGTCDPWDRHVLDSVQLVPLAPPEARSWADLGAGAGFPGLVCAAITRGLGRKTEFSLVEADGRKAAFLREAGRRLGIDVNVVHGRIESACLPPQDVISARALAPLDRLLDLAHPFSHPGTRLLFPKGRQADSELTLARRDWHIRTVRVPSRTDPEGTILQLSEVRRRP